LILATGPAILGKEDIPLRISGYTVSGDIVRVVVLNTSDDTLTGTVHVHAMLDGREAATWATVNVHGAQKAFVDLQLPSEVVEIIELGVVLDDGCPF
jgi:hypothetical protein